MNFLIDHPYWSYFGISIIFGAYVSARFTPNELRVRAKNFERIAKIIEKEQSQLPHPGIWLVGSMLAGFLWVYLIPRAVFNTVYRIIFGSEKIDEEN